MSMPRQSYNPQLAGGIGAAGTAAGQMIAPWKNPSNASGQYFDQMSGEINKGYDPWIQRGTALADDPGGKLNQIGQGYHQSPGFQFALQQALQGGNHAAAAGGMAGSPQHEQQNMAVATGLANQDYNQWMQNALGLHQLGYNNGQAAGIGKSQDLASILASKAQNAYEGQNSENQHEGGMWGSLLGGLGTAAGAYFGGPAGAAAGGAAGKAVGGWF